MSVLISAIEELVLATIRSDKSPRSRKGMTDWVLTALSVMLGGAGIALLAIRLDQALKESYSIETATVILSVTLLGSSFLVALILYLFRRQASPGGLFASKDLRSLVDGFCRQLGEPVRENPKIALLLFAIAGFFIAQKAKEQ